MWWEQLKKLISECLNVLVSGCNIFSKCTSVLANVSDITATAVSTQAHYVAEVRENYFPLCVSISSVAFCLIDFIFLCQLDTHPTVMHMLVYTFGEIYLHYTIACMRVCSHAKNVCLADVWHNTETPQVLKEPSSLVQNQLQSGPYYTYAHMYIMHTYIYIAIYIISRLSTACTHLCQLLLWWACMHRHHSKISCVCVHVLSAPWTVVAMHTLLDTNVQRAFSPPRPSHWNATFERLKTRTRINANSKPNLMFMARRPGCTWTWKIWALFSRYWKNSTSAYVRAMRCFCCDWNAHVIMW